MRRIVKGQRKVENSRRADEGGQRCCCLYCSFASKYIPVFIHSKAHPRSKSKPQCSVIRSGETRARRLILAYPALPKLDAYSQLHRSTQTNPHHELHLPRRDTRSSNLQYRFFVHLRLLAASHPNRHPRSLQVSYSSGLLQHNVPATPLSIQPSTNIWWHLLGIRQHDGGLVRILVAD